MIYLLVLHLLQQTKILIGVHLIYFLTEKQQTVLLALLKGDQLKNRVFLNGLINKVLQLHSLYPIIRKRLYFII